MDSIKALVLHRWVDHMEEGGLKLGLVKNKPGTVCGTDEKKPSFDVYAAFGTDREEAATQFALKIIGINQWKEIFWDQKLIKTIPRKDKP